MQRTALVILAVLVITSVALAQDNGTTQQPFCTAGKCGTTTQTCADGFAATCQQTCNEAAKSCVACTPSCTGHEQALFCPSAQSQCGQGTLTCPDGFVSSCQKPCDEASRSCLTCTPSCAGHEQQTTSGTNGTSGGGACPAPPAYPACTNGYVETKYDSNKCITGYECVVSSNASGGGGGGAACPSVSVPVCGQNQYANKRLDSNNCPMYECLSSDTSKPRCQTITYTPTCKEGEYLHTTYDSSGCPSSNECRLASTKPVACPVAPNPPPCEGGFLEKRFDNNGCVVGYECNINKQCLQVITPAKDDAGNCKEFSSSCLPPGWRRVDRCDAFKAPFCGDKICDIGESSNSCHDDCPAAGKDVVYTTQACGDGSQVQCKIYPDGQRACDQCPIQNLPQGCRQESDERGFTRVVCESKRVCQEIPQDVRLKCVEQKGIPVFKKDPSGCEQFFCQFSNEVTNPFSGYQECPIKTREQGQAEMQKCSSLGLRGVFVKEGGCNIVRCVEEKREEQCTNVPQQEKERIAAECRAKGFQGIWNRYEGCREIVECTSQSQETCPREVPPDAYKACSEKGGELIVQKNPNGCISFSRCVAPGDVSDTYIEKPTRVLESTELLSMAFKLESLNVDLDKLAKQTSDIAEYYKSTGSSEEGRFARVSDMFISAKEKVSEIKDRIRSRVDSLTEDDMMEIKRDLKYVKDVVIKDILYVMLSNSDDVKQLISRPSTTAKLSENDCGNDGGCFDRAFRLCKPVQFEPDDEVIVSIAGLEGDNCILKAKMKEGRGPPAGSVPGANPPYEMTCKVKNYALGMKGPEDIMPFCEGSMVELMKKFGPNGENAPGVPGKCSGDECRQYCGRGQQEAKECLEHLGPYLPPEAKQGLEMLASGKGGFSEKGGFGGGEEFRRSYPQQSEQQYKPQQRIRPDQCEFTDMTDQECVDYILKNLGSPPECKGLTDEQCRKFLVRSWENKRQQPSHGYGGPQGGNQGQGYCGDSVCDSFEQQNPSMCSQDCGPLLKQQPRVTTQAIQPSFVNGEKWQPKFDYESCTGCYSDEFKLQTSVPKTKDVKIDVLESRGVTKIAQYPSEENGFATKVLLDDSEAGASWYRFKLRGDGKEILEFKACIDGSDYLIIRDETVQYQHRGFQNPGSHDDCI